MRRHHGAAPFSFSCLAHVILRAASAAREDLVLLRRMKRNRPLMQAPSKIPAAPLRE